jgi:hypothetical protein
MTITRRRKSGTERTRLSKILLGLAIASVVVSYPPPVTGVEPFFGVGTMFFPLLGSTVALLLAIFGGSSLSHGLVRSRFGRLQRVLVRVSVSVGAVIAISAYLVVVAGFWPLSPFLVVAVGGAVVAGIGTEFIN